MAEAVGDPPLDGDGLHVGQREQSAALVGEVHLGHLAVPGMRPADDQVLGLQVGEHGGHGLRGHQAGTGERGRGESGPVGERVQRGVLRDRQPERAERRVLGGHQLLLHPLDVQSEAFGDRHLHARHRTPEDRTLMNDRVLLHDRALLP